MKKLMFSMLLVVFSMFFITPINDAQAAQREQNSVYKILPTDPQWSTMNSVREKIDACSIPKKVLRAMSDEELIDAVLEFPFIGDLFAGDSYKKGAESVYKNSDALQELASRETATAAILKRIKERKQLISNRITAEDEIINDEMMILIMHIDAFSRNLKPNDYIILEGFSALYDMKAKDLQMLE